MERSIHVDKAEYAAELFGSFDVNAKRLEKAFGVTFSCRDSQIHVIGEEPGVSRAVRAAESLLRLVEKGEVLNEDDAAVDLSRAYGAEGEALSEDGSGYVPVYMEVSAQVALGSSSDGGDSEGGTGGASNNDGSIQQALAVTGDKLLIPGLLVCAVASAAVVLIAWRKISQN